MRGIAWSLKYILSLHKLFSKSNFLWVQNQTNYKENKVSGKF